MNNEELKNLEKFVKDNLGVVGAVIKKTSDLNELNSIRNVFLHKGYYVETVAEFSDDSSKSNYIQNYFILISNKGGLAK